jgi:DNA invertase Pin-like site-specific DNA recombinase
MSRIDRHATSKIRIDRHATAKIRGRHLDRLAIVYVRQSTPHQVAGHRESGDLQYQLRRRASDLGWPDARVVVIDDDQGISGQAIDNRPGFQRLLAEVSLGRVGIVFGREVSRLSRSNKDWHQLLELCALFQVLIGDADGLYDPTDYNDRLLLGLRSSFPYCTGNYTSAAGGFPEPRPQPRLRAT